MRHNSRRIPLPVVLIILFLIFFTANTSVYGTNVKYVILMIADGWGPKQIEATNDYTGSAPLYQTDQVNWTSYYMSTYPFGGSYDPSLAWADFNYILNNPITDSAAAASAIYSGSKTAISRISVTEDGLSRLFTIGEEAKALNMAVGAVTSVYASHATPGAWVAHNDDRHNGYAIADEGFFGDPNITSVPYNPAYTFNSECVDVIPSPDGDGIDDATGIDCNYFGHHDATNPPVDVLIGAIGSGYTNNQIRDKLFNESGDPGKHIFVERMTGVNAVDTLASAVSNPSVVRLAGLFDQIYRLSDGAGYNSENPTLAESTNAALTVLSRNANGFMLMIEGGAVDWAGHNNMMDQMVGEMIDYNSAVQKVTDWVDNPSNDSNWNNTLVIATGDHECGYLSAGPGILPDQALGVVSPATIAKEKTLGGSGGRRASWEDNNPQNDMIDGGEQIYWAWNTGGHTNGLVPLYTRGAVAGLFDACIAGGDPVRGDYIDNTDVSQIIISAISGINETGSLSIMPGQSLSGQTIDLTSIASSINVSNIMYIVREDNDFCDVDMNGTYMDAEKFSGTISQGTATYTVENSQDGYLGTGYLRSNGAGSANCPPADEGKEYDINFTDAGTYKIWLRAYAPDAASDSIFIGLDGSCVGSLNRGGELGQWVWTSSIKSGTNTVNVSTTGHHSINIWIREANQLVDGIYITQGAEMPADASHGIEIDPSDCSKMYSGSEIAAQSVDTTGWTEGIKEIEVTGDDLTCLTPLLPATDSFMFTPCNDNDQDGYGYPGDSSCPNGITPDCDDNDGLEYPGQSWYEDADTDLYSSGASISQCERPDNYYAGIELTATYGDCNDTAAGINPGASELCDGVDNDCNVGTLDGSGETAPFNTKQAGVCSESQQSCNAGVWGDDYSAVSSYEADEASCDNLDNNCDDNIDEGCDDDGDGYCDDTMNVSGAPVPVCSASADGPGDDCDDSDPNIYPGGTSARIAGSPPVYSLLLQSAYDAAFADDIIQSREAEFAEDLNINLAISVMFEAGYDCSYTVGIGKTTINGNVTISQGTFVIKSGTLELK